jgi:hypothetical protein
MDPQLTSEAWAFDRDVRCRTSSGVAEVCNDPRREAAQHVGISPRYAMVRVRREERSRRDGSNIPTNISAFCR